MKFGDKVGVPLKKTLYWKKRKTPCTVDTKQKSFGFLGFGSKSCFEEDLMLHCWAKH